MSTLGSRVLRVACERLVRLACMALLSDERIISARNEFFEATE
jgi:hypothetical protein